LISILIPYFGNRSELLARTLYLLDNQTYKDFEVWIISDGGHLIYYSIPNSHLYLMPEHGNEWRTPNYAIKVGYEMCSGDYIVITSPEILPPTNALQVMMELDNETMSVPMLYKLSRKQTKHIDTVDWKTSLENLQELENFWSEEIHPGGFPNYDAKYNYHHGGFVGATRKVWDEIQITPTDVNNYESDSYWHVRLGELNRSPIRLPFGVYHQWHGRRDDPKRSARMERIYNSLV
jgi:glycosyltransferase involved in cell wall biosynthesis